MTRLRVVGTGVTAQAGRIAEQRHAVVCDREDRLGPERDGDAVRELNLEAAPAHRADGPEAPAIAAEDLGPVRHDAHRRESYAGEAGMSALKALGSMGLTAVALDVRGAADQGHAPGVHGEDGLGSEADPCRSVGKFNLEAAPADRGDVTHGEVVDREDCHVDLDALHCVRAYTGVQGVMHSRPDVSSRRSVGVVVGWSR